MWTLKENEVAYPWDDEIMAEVRQWKAEIIEQYGSIPETLHQHYVEDAMELAVDYDDTAAGALDAAPRDLSAARVELYRLIQEGIDDIENGRTIPQDVMMKKLRMLAGE
jgi:hypothetical protein